MRSDASDADLDLGQPLSRGKNDTSLLERRMTALDLDPYELGHAEAALVVCCARAGLAACMI